MFVHVVLFWLKKDGLADAKAKIAAETESLLRKIPSVRHIWSGLPAMTPRPVVDNSYDIAVCVCFDDTAGHDAYQEHPLHLQFVANNKPNFDRVLIYDFK